MIGTISVMTYAAAGDWDSAISSLMAVAGNDGVKSQRYMSATRKPSLSEYKNALKQVHEKVGRLPKGEPGKFGSPQAGNSKIGLFKRICGRGPASAVRQLYEKA